MTTDHESGSDGSLSTGSDVIPWVSIWRVVIVVLAAAALVFALFLMRSLVAIIVISVFFSLALEPAVRWLHHKRGWERGRSVAVIYLAGIGFLVVMVLVLIPAIVELADQIGNQGPDWVVAINVWSSDTFGVVLIEQQAGADAASGVDSFVGGWAEDAFGAITGIASTGATLLFSLATIAMFTFYFTVDSDRIVRVVLSWFNPRTQERILWTFNEAIVQTGGYFYSRTLLMIINAVGFLAVMVLVGLPVTLALPLAVFGGFVSVFIPVIGTYLGAAIPLLVTLAVEGLVAALIVLGYVLVYQMIENIWLSPSISAETMNLSGGLAFASALAGGSLAGPVGAFLALPTAALLVSFISNYAQTYDVINDSSGGGGDHDTTDVPSERPHRS